MCNIKSALAATLASFLVLTSGVMVMTAAPTAATEVI
jgi:hypothetical protein